MRRGWTGELMVRTKRFEQIDRTVPAFRARSQAQGRQGAGQCAVDHPPEKTFGHRVRFALTDQTCEAIDVYINATAKHLGDFLVLSLRVSGRGLVDPNASVPVLETDLLRGAFAQPRQRHLPRPRLYQADTNASYVAALSRPSRP